MKKITFIITFGFIAIIATGQKPNGTTGDSEKDIVAEFDTVVMEIDKTLNFSIDYKEFEAAPQWNYSEQKDLQKDLPVSMANAIRIAKDFLVSIGCNRKNYYLHECSLQRLYRFDSCTKWYWKISFGDDSFISSVDPIVTIPVMMDGKVPSYELKPVEPPEPE